MGSDARQTAAVESGKTTKGVARKGSTGGSDVVQSDSGNEAGVIAVEGGIGAVARRDLAESNGIRRMNGGGGGQMRVGGDGIQVPTSTGA